MASVHLGPFAGMLQSNSGSCEGFYLQLILVPLAALVAGWLPFVLARRPIHWAWAVAAWVFHILTAATCYGAALLSLAFWLS